MHAKPSRLPLHVVPPRQYCGCGQSKHWSLFWYLPGWVQHSDAPSISVFSRHAAHTPCPSALLNVPMPPSLQATDSSDWPCKSLNLPIPQSLQFD